MTFSILVTQGTNYLIIYIWLLLAVLLESSYRFSKYKQLYSLISAIIFILFIGLRWETGTDWDGYKELFDKIILDWDFLNNIYHFDIGYIILNAGVKYFTNNYSIFLLIDSAITVSLLYLLLKRIGLTPNIGWFLFYVNFMIIQFMGSNRRMIAMACILWMIYYISVNKPVKSAIFQSIAFVFHRSSISNILLYIIPKKIFSNRAICIMILIASIAGISQIPMKLIGYIAESLSSYTHIPLIELLNFYSEYGEEHLANGSGNLVISTLLAIAKRVIFLYFYVYIITKHKPDNITSFFFNSYFIGIVIYIMLIGSMFQMLSAYLALAEIILISRLYKFTTAYQKIIFIVFITLFGYIQLMNALNIYPELYIPYKSIV